MPAWARRRPSCANLRSLKSGPEGEVPAGALGSVRLSPLAPCRGGRSRRQDGPRLFGGRGRGRCAVARARAARQRRHHELSSDEPRAQVCAAHRAASRCSPGEVVRPLPEPPVTIGFESGVVAPPAELFLKNPSCALPARRSRLPLVLAACAVAPGTCPLSPRGGAATDFSWRRCGHPVEGRPDYDELTRQRRPTSREGWSCSLGFGRRARPSAYDGTTFDRISSRSTRMARIRRPTPERSRGTSTRYEGRARAPPP